jgi:hypothetical protein
LGQALSSILIEIPTPQLGKEPKKDPDDGNDDGQPDETSKPHFIKSATMHLFSSTAEFILQSPLKTKTIYITSINATALYHGEVVGRILYDLPFAVPPGESETPRFPVDWSIGSVGYEAIRKAVGGQLRLNASAIVGVRIEQWKERLWYEGHGIGAHIRL